MLRLVIVRHGNTFESGEVPRRVGSRTDIDLTATGQAQAEALGRAFSTTAFSRCLVSPLKRTRQTAEAILSAQPHPVPVETASFLAEIDHGPDENRTDDEIVARIGPAALADWDRLGEAPQGWIVDREARIAAWRALAATASDETLLLVTSNGAARFGLMAFGLPVHKIRTGAWGTILIPPGGPAEIFDWDQRPH